MADKIIEIKPKFPIPAFEAMEGVEFETVELSQFFHGTGDELIKFTAELTDGNPLPAGMTCEENGTLHGTPKTSTAKDTPYVVMFVAQTESSEPYAFSTTLMIWNAESLAKAEEQVKQLLQSEGLNEEREKIEKITNYWKDFAEGLPVPKEVLNQALTREITGAEVYYLFERFATLTVWNADDLTPAESGKLLELEHASPHYHVYDFDVALVATPKDLFSHDRTPKDAIQTARALIDEIDERKWNIEIAGFDKMMTAAWVAVQEANRAHPDRQIYVTNYEPSMSDYQMFINRVEPK